MATIVSGNITAYTIAGSTPAGPTFVAFTPDGELWFSQEQNQEVGRLTISGTQSYPVNAAGPSQPEPTALLVGTDGNIWFAEYNGAAIAKLDPCSKTVTRYSTNVSGSTPWGLIQGPDNAMWFVDPGSNEIGRIDYSGNVQEFPIHSQYSNTPGPAYIALGGDGNLWFTEYNIGAVGVFSPTTHLLLKEYSSDDGERGPYPNQIVVGPDNNMWWINSGIGTLATISPSASVTTNPTEYSVYPASSAFAAHFIANIASSGSYIWTADSHSGVVQSFNTSGQNVASYDIGTLGLTLSGFQCGPGQFGCTSNVVGNSTYPYGISGGPDGRIYVALYNANAVVAIQP